MPSGMIQLARASLYLAALGFCGGAFAAPDEIHWTVTGPTSVTFDWRGSPAENAIAYGLNAGSYSSTVTAANPTAPCIPWSSVGPFWEARLTGLLPNTLYHYSIANGPDHTFRTPPPASASSFVVLAEGDIGDSSSYSNMPLIQQLMAQELDARIALLVGDLTYGEHPGSPIDQHFNDVMVWSRDVAYMPAWGNHEFETPLTDDLRNYKGRFDFGNPRTTPGGDDPINYNACGEDWYWFDYGNVRFIAYPEPWTGAITDWNTQATPLMNAAQTDPNIRFIVTFGHRPAYSSGNHPGEGQLKGYLDALAATHTKYVLNINGHSHNYERSYPQNGSGDNQNGAIHVTVGTGGASLQQVGGCLWPICTQPSWSAARYMRLGYLKLTFTPTSIQGAFVCGPAGGGTNDIVCTPGSTIDSFSIGGPPGCVDTDGDGYGNPGDASCPNGAAIDCANNNPAVYPGAPQVCDGVNNNCSAAGWPALSGTNEFDNDGDGKTACAGDCNDANPFCRDTCADSDADGACNDRDNCPAVSNSGQADTDGDAVGDACDTCTDTDSDGYGNPGFPANTCPLDCAPADPLIHLGSAELNDGIDNTCPGESGYGLIDETSGDSGFHSAVNPKTDYSWPAQQGATLWQVGRASSPDFSLGCGTVQSATPQWTDAQTPVSGQAFYYLNRPVAPFVGSWGAHSSGVEWSAVCPATAPTIREVSVAASFDDAEESATASMVMTSSDLDLTSDLTTSQRASGMRFNGLAIPHGARILSAYVQFTVRNATSAAASLRIEAQNADNPAAFASTTGNITGRSRTAAFASWAPPAWNTVDVAGPDQKTPDLSAIVREIVSRPGWVSGNSLVLIITGSGDRSAQSTDYNGGTGAPRLHVEFDGGTP